jgi:TetR/AcrR family transcriptional regulator, fatty acid metabolism regulator protein
MPSEQDRSRARHEKILDAALGVFTTRGYRDAAVDDIASAAETSKGGVYFHFPGKQAIFLALLERTSTLLLSRIVDAVESEPDPIAKVDAALLSVVRTFASHRSLARLFLVEAFGAGPDFHARMSEIHGTFTDFIKRNLDEAVRLGVVEPLDTEVASQAWFGALDHIVTRWVLSESPGRLEDSYPALRALLLRSIGLPADNRMANAGSKLAKGNRAS